MSIRALSLFRQRLIGLTLAAAVLAAWLSVHLSTLFLIQPAPTGMVAVALIALQCWLNVGLFIIAHDCMHGSLAPGWVRLNTAIGTLSLFVYAGFSYAKLKPKHFEHHARPGTTEDPDWSAAHPDQAGRWYFDFVRRYFGLREFAILTALLTMYTAVFGVALERMLAFWALPAIASSFQLFYFGTFLPHRDSGVAFVDEHRARSNAYGYLGSLISCFHFGYHHEHHLSPRTPWWALPALRVSR